MIVYPNAKINIGLNVIAKRPDGFHNIETCFYPVSIFDLLEFIENKRVTTFTSTGISIPGGDSDNICIKAWQLLNRKYGIPPVSIHLHKSIPIGAGLGGGSADGAFMLRGLTTYFKLNVGEQELLDLGTELGSDCAFFLLNSPAIGVGKGNILERIDMSLGDYKIVLVNPGIHVNTAEAYSSIIPMKPTESLAELLKQPIDKWLSTIKNDFEPAVFGKYPRIEEIKNELLEMDALYAAMSGSGSTLFGIFWNGFPDQENIYEKFKDCTVHIN